MINPIRTRGGLRLAAAILALGLAGLPQADAVRAQGRRPDADVQRITNATAVLSQIVSSEDQTIPRAVLEKARGIVVFPPLRERPRRGEGPITRRTARRMQPSARGILSARREGGGWSPPAFLTITGDDIPYDADVVLVLMNQSGLDKAMRFEFAIDAEAPVAPGPVGRGELTDQQQRAEILSYSRRRGMLAGVPMAGTIVRGDAIANQRFYGKQLTTARAIAQESEAEVVTAWRKTLEQHFGR